MSIAEKVSAATPDDVSFDTFLSNGGRNGKVFLVKVRGVDTRVVCKISRIIDFSIPHEYAVMEKLAELQCPNFTVPYATLSIPVDCNYRRKLNPFIISSKMYPINADVLLMEYVDGISLENFSKTNSIKMTAALTRQVILAVCMAQERTGFTHYDLHPGNVIVRKTDLKQVQYTVSGETYTVQTNGFLAVIIDYGLSYIDGLEWQTSALFYTDVGVYSNRSRPFYDIRRLLVGVQNDTGNKRLSKFVKSVYGKNDIDWKHGWDVTDTDCAINHIVSKCYDRRTAVSRVFGEYGPVCVALVQALIKHPMTNVCGVRGAYNVLETEFAKVENVIGSCFYNIYILKNMIVSARSVLDQYITDSKRESAVQTFRRDIVAVVDTISKFAQMRDVNWERLLCALYAFAAYMDGEMSAYMAKTSVDDMVSRERDIDIYKDFTKIIQ